MFVLWMTGLPCSGKTTIARKLQEVYPKLALLDGDELREWLSPKDFSRDGRNEHNRRVAHLTKLLLKHDVSVLVSLISPFNENREDARKIIGDSKFIETYIECPLSVCEERDVKGMYKKARLNEISNFTGVNDDYDIPDNPDLIINTENNSLNECVDQITEYLDDYKSKL
uniref:Adenylyl-sulfate kinase n=1 Tax=uncultured marine thaumarchaeote KM3_32_A02 TaxID=1456122 RepID=A0A075H484_9ARCH|nr:adenylylsulfate kinase (cysC) [uncultured marine thaumarchaeote KM3_32_A02]